MRDELLKSCMHRDPELNGETANIAWAASQLLTLRLPLLLRIRSCLKDFIYFISFSHSLSLSSTLYHSPCML